MTLQIELDDLKESVMYLDKVIKEPETLEEIKALTDEELKEFIGILRKSLLLIGEVIAMSTGELFSRENTDISDNTVKAIEGAKTELIGRKALLASLPAFYKRMPDNTLLEIIELQKESGVVDNQVLTIAQTEKLKRNL